MAQGWPSHADGEEGVQLRSDQERESSRVLGRRRVAWSFANCSMWCVMRFEVAAVMVVVVVVMWEYVQCASGR